MLGALGWWGHGRTETPWRWALMLALPLAAATLWGVFATPGDPSRSGSTVVATAGWLRLGLELGLFAAALAALVHGGARWPALALGVALLVHHAASYERLAWLVRQ